MAARLPPRRAQLRHEPEGPAPPPPGRAGEAGAGGLLLGAGPGRGGGAGRGGRGGGGRTGRQRPFLVWRPSPDSPPRPPGIGQREPCPSPGPGLAPRRQGSAALRPPELPRGGSGLEERGVVGCLLNGPSGGCGSPGAAGPGVRGATVRAGAGSSGVGGHRGAEGMKRRRVAGEMAASPPRGARLSRRRDAGTDPAARSQPAAGTPVCAVQKRVCRAAVFRVRSSGRLLPKHVLPFLGLGQPRRWCVLKKGADTCVGGLGLVLGGLARCSQAPRRC